MKFTRLLFFFILIISTSLSAQVTQVLRGTIIDKQSETPLIGAAIEIINSNPIQGSITDVNGNFEIISVTSGRYTLQISFVGYNTATISNIVVNAGKETVLNLSLGKQKN